MITAMQMMLDDLISKREVYENAKMYQCVATLETSIEIAEYLLEKEKEQLDDMFEEGFESAYQHFVNGKDFVQFEQYYNETFKSE